nr:hypothetical protein [Dictyobacter alpinus]
MDFEVGPGEFEVVGLAVAQVVGDGAGGQGGEGEGEGPGERVVAGVARDILGDLVVGLPDAVAIEAIGTEADVQAGEASVPCGLADDGARGGVVKGVDDQDATCQQLGGIAGGQFNGLGLDSGLDGSVEEVGQRTRFGRAYFGSAIGLAREVAGFDTILVDDTQTGKTHAGQGLAEVGTERAGPADGD